MKDRILVNENEIKGNMIVSQANETAAIINALLVPAMETIGATLTDDSLKDCLMGGEKTRKSYFEAVENDLKATRTPSIRNQMTEAANEAYETFENVLTRLRSSARNYKFLSIVEGKAMLTQENEEKLRDTARIYITEPKEIEAYKLHCEIIAKMNQLFKGNIPYRWQNIFGHSSTGIFRNDETDYSKLV